MKRVMFELTMPSNNSWNGKWSGENNKYTISKSLRKDKEHLIGQNFSYNFGDGWVANVECRLALSREKASNKFCGYNWMIDSILWNGEIKI